MVVEAVGDLELEAGPAPFLLVTADPLPAAGEDGLEAEESVGLQAEPLAAGIAHVGPDADGVVVAARLAASGLLGFGAGLCIAGELDTDDLVPRTLVVDQRSRAELVDGEEAGSLEVVAVALAARAAALGDVGGERQAGEGVSGQEALGGEVAVGVEVRLAVLAVLVAEQDQLIAGIGRAALGDLAAGVGSLGVDGQLVLLVVLLQGRAVEGAPPLERLVEALRRALDLVGDPAVVPPGDGFRCRHPTTCRSSSMTASARCVPRRRTSASVRARQTSGRTLKDGFSPPASTQVGDPRLEGLAGLGEPDGVHVGAHEILVRQVEARCGHGPGDHVPSSGGSSRCRERCPWRSR